MRREKMVRNLWVAKVFIAMNSRANLVNVHIVGELYMNSMKLVQPILWSRSS